MQADKGRGAELPDSAGGARRADAAPGDREHREDDQKDAAEEHDTHVHKRHGNREEAGAGRRTVCGGAE